jgi:hypothetical protein
MIKKSVRGPSFLDWLAPQPLSSICKIMGLIRPAEEDFFKYLGHYPRKGEVMDCLVVGTADGYKGHGLAETCCKLSEELSKKKGYQVMAAYCTNTLSQALFKEKLGCHIAAIAPYDTYLYRGQSIFKNVTNQVIVGRPEPCTQVVTKPL